MQTTPAPSNYLFSRLGAFLFAVSQVVLKPMISILRTGERVTDYTLANNYIFQRHYFAYHAVASLISGHTIELGCGAGYGANLLINYTPHFIAIDRVNPGATLDPRIAFRQVTLPDLKQIPRHSAHTIICFQVIEHVKRDEFFLSEVSLILKPGGQLFLTTPNVMTTLTRNPFHVREYTPQELEDLVKLFFTDVALQGVFGNEKVLDYYQRNRKAVETIRSFDIFNLQYLLPAWLLRTPYTIMNNLSRLMLFKSDEDGCKNISFSDFYLDTVTDHCFDLFVHARK